jgi:PBSX family phage terminase large subunit
VQGDLEALPGLRTTVILESLTEKQRDAWAAVAGNRLVVCDGSVRSGKSVASDVAWIDFCRHAPDGNLLMVGKTERTLKRNVVDPLIEILGAKRCRYVGGSGELWVCGRRVYLAGANDERAEEKIRGLTLIGAYVDEASTVPESFWTMLLSRLSLDGSRLIATTNPDSPMHWLKRDYLDRAEELGLKRFQFKLTDNPWLPASYVEAIRREYTGLWRKRFIDGEWCIAEGSVYEDWDPARHVLPAGKLPQIAQILSVGVDVGTTNATRGYLVGISAEDRPRLVVIDEWAPTRMTDAGLSAGYRKWIGHRAPQWICVDPSAASFKLQLFSDGFSNVMNASNAVLDGIRTIASLLATDRIVVSDACVELLREFPSYVWDPKATLRGEDKPLKERDHSVDALRYAVATTRQLWGNRVPLTIPVEEDAA